jgi:nitrogen fixation/metabolism regulation signal transduction histidine kinase
MEEQVKLPVKMKLVIGFLLFYIISGAVPGTVSFFISVFDLDRAAVDFLIPVLTLSVTLIICVIVGLYLRKWIARPINKLVRATEEMARGNLDVDLRVETGDEIESYAESLSRMKASLQIAHDMLGPPDMEKDAKPEEITGFSAGEKVVFALILFLIYNPIVTTIPILLFEDPSVLTILGIAVLPFIFTVMLLVIIVYHLNNSIMNPFIFLAKTADKISKGDFSTKIEVRSSGDIGRLEQSFKLISEKIQRAMKELESDA